MQMFRIWQLIKKPIINLLQTEHLKRYSSYTYTQVQNQQMLNRLYDSDAKSINGAWENAV